MHRKILGICMALVAFGALALGPSSASAFKTHLTDTVGGVKTVVAVNSKLKGIGTPSTFEAGTLKVECNENAITGTVVANETATGKVQVNLERAMFDSNLTTSGTDCKSEGLFTNPVKVTVPQLEGGGKFCLSALAEDKGTVGGAACGVAPEKIEFILDATNLTNCTFVRKATLAGTYNTPGASNASELSLNANQEFKNEPRNFLCPEKGTITAMQFKLYTDTDGFASTAAMTAAAGGWDDSASTADPVWFEE